MFVKMTQAAVCQAKPNAFSFETHSRAQRVMCISSDLVLINIGFKWSRDLSRGLWSVHRWGRVELEETHPRPKCHVPQVPFWIITRKRVEILGF